MQNFSFGGTYLLKYQKKKILAYFKFLNTSEHYAAKCSLFYYFHNKRYFVKTNKKKINEIIIKDDESYQEDLESVDNTIIIVVEKGKRLICIF